MDLLLTIASGFANPAETADSAQSWRRGNQFWVNGCGECLKTFQQCWRGGIEKLIADAVHAAILNRLHFCPPSVADDFFKRHAIAGAAPGGNHNIWILRQHRCR